MPLTQKFLKSILHYDPITGVFTWLRRPVRPETLRENKIWNTRYAGQRAGYTDPHGHTIIVITVDGKKRFLRAHRLAWLYVFGSWPKDDLDHKNYDPSDNSVANLREASRSQNNANSGPPRDNKSGKKGVCWDSARSLWRAEICKDGIKYQLGRFSSFEEACLVRTQKAIELYGEFARED